MIDKETIAQIRNKLQAPMTALDLLAEGEDVPKEFIEKAKKDLEGIVKLLNNAGGGIEMLNRYGYPFAKWNKAKEEMKQILIGIAKAGGKIPYSELVAKVKTITLQPESYALANMLGEISTEENAAGRGMLSVVVVHKSGDTQPGTGFFELAKELGRDTSNHTRCWIEEFNRVHTYWSVT